jgi:hypothetical protein
MRLSLALARSRVSSTRPAIVAAVAAKANSVDDLTEDEFNEILLKGTHPSVAE